ncbi:hypothetical protein [Sinomicrobium weinanense]|nr:hypothetical protein [Sinomicrobium weinanense]
MSERYKVIDSTHPTFITITVTDWVDLCIIPVEAGFVYEESHG